MSARTAHSSLSINRRTGRIPEEAQKRIEDVADWRDRWRAFHETTKPSMARNAQQALERALAKLGQAVDILPDGPERIQVARVFDRVRNEPKSDWSIPDLSAAFAEFNPDRIRAKIDRIEAALEKGSFEDAKAKWLERIRSDDDAIRAVDRLERLLRQYGETLSKANTRPSAPRYALSRFGLQLRRHPRRSLSIPSCSTSL